MRRITTLVAVLLACSAAPAYSRAENAATTGCQSVHTYNVVLHHALHYSVGGHGGDFHARPASRQRISRLGAMRACWKRSYRPAYRVERRAWERRVRTWREYRHLDAITRCGEFVVCGVVDNESATSGYYRASNPGGCSGHGCLGAYQIDQGWYSSSCSRLSRVRWQIWAQHECAYIILRVQGLGAWAGDGAYL